MITGGNPADQVEKRDGNQIAGLVVVRRLVDEHLVGGETVTAMSRDDGRAKHEAAPPEHQYTGL